MDEKNLLDLPEELLMNVMSFLSYRDRDVLAKCGFQFNSINERLKNLEEILLIKGLVNGDCIWSSYSPSSSNNKMPARFLHGTSKINEVALIFGGTSSATFATCGYNDLWQFSQDGYERVETGGTYPLPRANFATTQIENSHILISGGVFQRENSFFADNTSYRDVYVYDAEKFLWTKLVCEGEEPSILFIHRATMLSKNEMLVFGGGAFVYSNPKILRAINEMSILQLNQNYTEGKWIRVKNWVDGISVPARFGHHQYLIAPDTILIYGGSGSGFNGNLNDAWAVKIFRSKNNSEYTAKAFKLNVENQNAQVFQSFLYPSCLVGDKLVFVGCRTNTPETPKCDEEKSHRRTPSQSSDNSENEAGPSVSPKVSQIVTPNVPINSTARKPNRGMTPRKITINNQLPLNTIGAMTAFQVAPSTSTSPSIQRPISSQPNKSPESSEPKLRKILEIRKTETPKKSNTKSDNLGNDRKLFLFVLDVKEVLNKSEAELSKSLSVKWLSLKNDGLLPNAPERTCFSTLNRLDNKLALIAGLQRYSGQDDNQSSVPTNAVHFIELPKNLL